MGDCAFGDPRPEIFAGRMLSWNDGLIIHCLHTRSCGGDGALSPRQPEGHGKAIRGCCQESHCSKPCLVVRAASLWDYEVGAALLRLHRNRDVDFSIGALEFALESSAPASLSDFHTTVEMVS